MRRVQRASYPLSYDGLDPDEQRDPHTGRYWSTDMTHYQPLCAAH
jgi:hypothetical protein